MKQLSLISLTTVCILFFAGCKKNTEEPSSCTDGIQNGTETGVDCGGSCSPCVTGCGTVIDIDGNVYNTVTVGSQCWTRENLRVTRFRNNTPIPHETSQSFWANLSNTGNPAYCYYDNDPQKEAVYGKLYNWFAASSGQLCPEGWHVATKAEWDQLISYLGGANAAADKLRAVNTDLWGTYDGATNTSGFSALPGGLRDNQGNFRDSEGFLSRAAFWSSSEYDTYWAETGAWISDGSLVQGSERKNAGMSCRCIKNTGSSGTPSCTDGIQNGQETGIDCGGPDCDPCATVAMSAYINGVYWSTSEALAQDLGQLGLKIRGNMDGIGQGILIDLGEYHGPDTYVLQSTGSSTDGIGFYYPSVTNQNTYYQTDMSNTGTLIISSDSGTEITGTFTFTVSNGTQISSGEFTAEF